MSTLLPCGTEMSDARGEMEAIDRELRTRIDTGTLVRLAYAWSSISKDQLVDCGIISKGPGGSDWERFNDDPMTFVIKLPADRLAALCKLLNDE